MQRLLVILVLVTSASAVLAADKPARIAGGPSPEVTAPADVSVEATGASTPVKPGEISGSFPVGKTIIKWTATDEHGNTTSGMHTVIVADTTVPKVIAPADVSVEATGPTTSVELGAAVAEDIVDGVLSAIADQTGPFVPGRHTITWSATDAAGNTASATQIVTVTDSTPPVLTAPADVIVEATGPSTPVALGETVVKDLVDGAVAINHDAPAGFGVGVKVVTWTAIDAAGNLGQATQTITVSDTT
ncbi:MAG: Hyalin, partial [Gammaproteobacteria bacterium]